MKAAANYEIFAQSGMQLAGGFGSFKQAAQRFIESQACYGSPKPYRFEWDGEEYFEEDCDWIIAEH